MSRRITSYYRDGLTFDVRDEGPLDGKVAVLLPGFPERGRSWRDVAPGAAALGESVEQDGDPAVERALVTDVEGESVAVVGGDPPIHGGAHAWCTRL